MLPSRGYFSEIPCVFYLGEGCRRETCHYSHSKEELKSVQEDERPKETNETNPTWSEAQINLVTRMVKEAVEKAFLQDSTGNIKIDKSKMIEVTLNKVLLDDQAVKWALSHKKIHDNVRPSYEPTPIAKLANQHVPVVYVPSKPIPNARQFESIRPSTTAFSNKVGDTSQNVSAVPHYAGNGSTGQFTNGPSKRTRELNYGQRTCNDDMDWISVDVRDDSNTRNLATDDKPQNSGSSLMEFKSTAAEQTASCTASSMFSPEEGFPVQRNADCSVNYYTQVTDFTVKEDYDEIVPHQSEHRKEKLIQPIEEILVNKNRTNRNKSDVKQLMDINLSSSRFCSREDEPAPQTTQNATKLNKKPSLKLPNPKSKLTESSNDVQNEKKCLSLKRSKFKTSFNTETPKIEGKVAESRQLKRNNSDPTIEKFPAKKSKASSNPIPENLRLSEKMFTNNDLLAFKKESIESKKKLNNSEKPLTLNFHVTSNPTSNDPFIRWMTNKRIRAILDKKKIEKQNTNNNVPVKNQKLAEKVNTSQNPVVSCASIVENKESESLPVPKFYSRVAHKKDEVRPYPSVLDCIKIPLSYRQYFCDAFFREFKKSMNVVDAKKEAVKRELDVAKSSSAKTYKNHGSLQLMKLRKNGYIKNPEVKQVVKLDPSSCPDFTYGWSLYRCFSEYLLSETEMRESGYPMMIPGKANCAYVEKSARKYSKQQPDKPNIRVCSNCSEEFEIDKVGVPLFEGNCFYHWGKLRKVRVMGQWMEKFTCCDGWPDSAPCESSIYHVWSGRNEDYMEDFVETTKKPSYMEDCDAGIYALDCEMVYTSKGLELARLTVIDLNEDVVFDQVVSLKCPVLNYCTRFSGIDERKIREATYTFDDVREWVLEHFFDKTILIGHSLENDLTALKLIHKRVIDTAIIFPHKFGPPHRMSLKHLASSVLKINIQEDEGGHDSKEDAATCLKLMKIKIKEDSKVRKPRTIIGYIGKKR